MTDTSIDLSGQIDEGRGRNIRDVAGACDALAVPFFLVGAFARDLLLELRHGFKAQRATNDVDFGVRVGRWEEFEALKRALAATGRYSPDPNKVQRLIAGDGGLIDIVPFGEVEDASGRITWPPGHEVVMNALGFGEAFEHSVRVRIAEDLEVRVSSLAGLALMKLIAWDDRRFNRDARDLRLIMTCYLQAGNEERVFGERGGQTDLLDDDKFVNVPLTGARLLGRDVGAILTEQSLKAVKRILAEQTAGGGGHPLVAAMIGGAFDIDEAYEEALRALEMFGLGISDVRQS
jgi:predicted nucleotidyltransferase